jgi:predicted phosphodiesterase
LSRTGGYSQNSHLESLEKILADFNAQKVSDIICLGDIVGYGPNPRECIELLISCKVCLLGNHDQGALFDPEGFHTGAERALYWTRSPLGKQPWRSSPGPSPLGLLGRAAPAISRGGFSVCARLGPKSVERICLSRRYLQPPQNGKNLRPRAQICFSEAYSCPGRFTEDLRFLSPEDINYEYRLGVQKLMINVGSVGQPRDGDPRACYVIIDGDTIRFRRVEYPWEQTIQKIYAIPQLDNFLGDRLREGRGTAFLSPALKTLSCRVK